MAGEVVVRGLRPDETERLVEIAIRAWTPIYGTFRRILGDELFAVARPDWEQEKARQVRAACDPDDRAMVGVAELDGRIVGFVTFYADERSRIGEIGNNAVDPDFQGRGIGPRMYEYVFDRLRERGMRFVEVSTGLDPGHAPARRAYEKAGFSIQLPMVKYYRKL